MSCEHKWIYIDTKKRVENHGFLRNFIKSNNYYCEKCLEHKTTKQESFEREEPDWF